MIRKKLIPVIAFKGCIFTLFLFTPFCYKSFAQDTTASVDSVFSDKAKYSQSVSSKLQMSQSAYSNWTKGGQNSFAWNIIVDGTFRRDKSKYFIQNKTKLTYGKTKINGSSRVHIDGLFSEFLISNKKKNLSIFASAKAESQFDVGRNYKVTPHVSVSNFLDPIYVTISSGVSFPPTKIFKTRLGFSGKATFTKDYPKWSDNPKTPGIEKYRFERGVESVTDVNLKIMENVSLRSKWTIFSQLKKFNTTDMNLTTLLSARVNKYLSVDFNHVFIYDIDQSKKPQMSELIAMGIGFNII